MKKSDVSNNLIVKISLYPAEAIFFSYNQVVTLLRLINSPLRRSTPEVLGIDSTTKTGRSIRMIWTDQIRRKHHRRAFIACCGLNGSINAWWRYDQSQYAACFLAITCPDNIKIPCLWQWPMSLCLTKPCRPSTHWALTSEMKLRDEAVGNILTIASHNRLILGNGKCSKSYLGLTQISKASWDVSIN